jgi:hypothetical protein
MTAKWNDPISMNLLKTTLGLIAKEILGRDRIMSQFFASIAGHDLFGCGTRILRVIHGRDARATLIVARASCA